MLNERSHTGKTANCIIPFTQHSRKGKNYEAKIKGVTAGTKGGRRVLITKRPETTFSGDENILYRNCGGGYTTIYICQNS